MVYNIIMIYGTLASTSCEFEGSYDFSSRNPDERLGRTTKAPLSRLLSLVLPLVAFTTLATACESASKTSDETSTSESIPDLTSITPATEVSTTTVLESTTTIMIDNEEVANCRRLRDSDRLPGGYLEQIGVPRIDEMEFFVGGAGDCEKVKKGDIYFWGWAGDVDQVNAINAKPPEPVTDANGNVYSPYDTNGVNYRELPAGSSILPKEAWNAVHPVLPGSTLLELAQNPGAKICWHVGLNDAGGFDKEYTFERLELRTDFNRETMTEPEYSVWVVYTHANGTSQGKDPAWVMGVLPETETKAWQPFWTDLC